LIQIRTVGIISFLLFTCLAQAQEASRFDDRFRAFANEYGGRVGVAAKDIATGETIRFNSDSLFPTASIIKLPVLVELFTKFHDGELSPEQPILLLDSLKKPGSGVLQFFHGGQTLKLIDIATLMIIVSDNTGTNYVVDQFGSGHDEKLEAVNGRMRSLGLQQTKLLNKLYSFATKKKTEEARRFGVGVTCPDDMIQLLELIASGRMINKAVSDSIIDMMRKQFYQEQAQRYLPFTEDTTLWVANKTGSLDAVKNDVGIVASSRGTYVYAIFCDGSKDLGEQTDNIATLVVAKISKLLYDHFMKK
jgi:beta-lactamase class A